MEKKKRLEKKREEAALVNLEKLQKDLNSEKRKKARTEIGSNLSDKDVEMSDQKQLKKGIQTMSLQPSKKLKKSSKLHQHYQQYGSKVLIAGFRRFSST